MLKLIKSTTNYSALDNFNVKTADSLKSLVDKQMEVLKVAIFEEDKEDGSKILISHFVTPYSSYVSISDLIADQAGSVIDILESGESASFDVKEKTSANGRRYLILKMS